MDESGSWNQALEIWATGGWGMVALAVDAVLIFYLGFSIFFELEEKGIYKYRRKREKMGKRSICRKGAHWKNDSICHGARTLKEIKIY